MLNIAEINLTSLKKNALSIKKKLPEKTKFCAVVKADAYGHGAEECARALYSVADCFAVALTEEGVRLRQSGIDKDILVLIPPFPCDIRRGVEYSLTFAADSLSQIKLIDRESKKQGKKTKIHLKFDSGMNRFGVSSVEEVKSLAEYAAKRKNIFLEGIFTHFYDAIDDEAVKIQYDKFLLAIKAVRVYNKNVIRHISASGGFLKGYYLDMVRIGILLYGYKPFKNASIGVKPVMKVYSPCVKRKVIKGGDTALYGGKRADKDTNALLVRYGYADGLPRKEVSGQFNNRCMDVSLQTQNVGKNGFFTVLDDADVLAEKYGTISYEILTKVALRAEKIYIR